MIRKVITFLWVSLSASASLLCLPQLFNNTTHRSIDVILTYNHEGHVLTQEFTLQPHGYKQTATHGAMMSIAAKTTKGSPERTAILSPQGAQHINLDTSKQFNIELSTNAKRLHIQQIA